MDALQYFVSQKLSEELVSKGLAGLKKNNEYTFSWFDIGQLQVCIPQLIILINCGIPGS